MAIILGWNPAGFAQKKSTKPQTQISRPQACLAVPIAIGRQAPRGLMLFVLLVLGTWNLCLGSSKVDSLQTLLQTNLHDTTRITTLNALGWELKYSNPDTGIILCKQALKLAIEKRDPNDGTLAKAGKKGQANSLRNLGVFNYLKGNYPTALENHH